MRAAHGHAQRLDRGSPAVQRDVIVAIATKRADAALRMPDHAGHRRLHDRQDRHACVDQCKVDGEFALALDELAGAVQRVDQPQARPLTSHQCRHVLGGFLREDGDVRRQSLESGEDAVMRGEIRRRQRRAVVLVRDVKRIGIDRHDADGGVARQRDQRLAQRLQVKRRHGAAIRGQ